ncbi:putative pol polyprotein [Trichonephila clavipes]|nr:putative pol polyprotein [Trichonephila clavipes]
MAPWPRAPVIPQLVDRKTFRDNRWVRHLSLTSCSRQYLVDTGTDLSVIPPTQAEKRKPSDSKLDAVNSTIIKTYGSKVLKLDVGSRRQFTWSFTIADVKRPILGADFLKHFGLLVDLKLRRLMDSVTFLHVLGKTTECQPLSLTTLGSSLYIPKVLALLEEFKNITFENSNKLEIKHNVTHAIITTGPPLSAKVRRLSPEKTRVYIHARKGYLSTIE